MDRLPTFVGIKYSDAATLCNLPLLQRTAPGLEFLSGSDEGYLQCIAQGYQAAVGSTYNYAAPLYHRVLDAFESADLVAAQQQQATSVQLVKTLQAFGISAAGKALMGMLGVDCGPVRSPLRPLAEDQLHHLLESVQPFDCFPRSLAPVHAS